MRQTEQWGQEKTVKMFEVRVILLCLPSILLATTLEPGKYTIRARNNFFFFLLFTSTFQCHRCVFEVAGTSKASVTLQLHCQLSGSRRTYTFGKFNFKCFCYSFQWSSEWCTHSTQHNGWTQRQSDWSEQAWERTRETHSWTNENIFCIFLFFRSFVKIVPIFRCSKRRQFRFVSLIIPFFSFFASIQINIFRLTWCQSHAQKL